MTRRVAAASEKKFLSAEDILSADDIKTVDVEVPEWGGTVRLRMMSGEEAIRFVDVVSQDKSGSAIKVVAMCAVREDGTPLFSEGDLDRLKGKSLKAIMRLQKRALEINGLTEEKTVEAKND